MIVNKDNDMKLHIKIIGFGVLVIISGWIPLGHAYEGMLEGFINEALQNNPKIQESYHRWKAAEYKIKSVKSLDDPMLGITLPGEHVETRLGPQERKYAISQKIPFPGKLSLKGRVQSKQAEIHREQYESTKSEIIKNVKFVYYDLFWIDRAVAINEEEKAILEKLEKVAQRKYESNLIPQQDVIKAQVELTKLTDKLYLLNQNRKSLTAKMNSILNRDRNTEIPGILDVSISDFSFSLEKLIETAKESRQELKASQLAVERADYEKSLSKMSYLPDFTFGVDYIEVGGGTTTHPDDGKDAWMAMVSVNLPLWFGKNASQVNEKKAELAAAENNSVNMENTTVYEVEDMYYKIAAYKDILSLYKTSLIPQSDQAFDAARSGCESGQVDFLNWLDAERNLLQTRLAYYKSMSDYLKSVAYLERVVGQSLFTEGKNEGDSK